jgi:hypothetical protein
MNTLFATWFSDRKHRVARTWSNRELAKFAHLFTGKVVNVSGWQDNDKEGRSYRSYFKNAQSYDISNYEKDTQGGLQGYDNEFFLDLTKPLSFELAGKYEVVFNHTSLEHIYDFKTAFYNLCTLSSDLVIIVVPFLQPMHTSYGDYWRFSPMAMKQMFEDNKYTLLYSSFNNEPHSSVYLFAIGSKQPTKWRDQIFNEFTYHCQCGSRKSDVGLTGCRAITNPPLRRFYSFVYHKILGR